MLHVAILLKPYIQLILSGAKTVESRLTVTPRTPYRRIAPGERIYFKASSGPYMATAIAAAVEFHENLTPARIDALRRRHNAKVRGQPEYWQLKRNSRYATFIRLRDVQPTSTGPRIAPSRGPAWFTIPEPANSSAAKSESFFIPLTKSAFTTRVLRVPRRIHQFEASVYGGTTAARKGASLQLHMPDRRVVSTDLVARDRKFRWRGWPAYFAAHGMGVGDRVHFERAGPLAYRVTFARQPGSEQKEQTMRSRAVAFRTSPVRQSSGPSQVRLKDFINSAQLNRLIRAARREDMGPRGDDITSRLFVPIDRSTKALLRSREAGRLSGAALLPAIAAIYDSAIVVTPRMQDGQALTPGDVAAEFSGPLRSVLAMERVALNFMTHLSGIASLTAQFVAAVAGTKAGICDTRKTLPGLRALERYAVVCGGGRSHRMGLHDAVLVKDNHLAHLSLAELPKALGAALAKARQESPVPSFIEIEVDSLAQLEQVLPLQPDIVLLDNMTPDQIEKAVAMRDRLVPGVPGVELEASGRVRLDNVRQIALTGVDRIAIGFLTHSAPALDLGLDIEP